MSQTIAANVGKIRAHVRNQPANTPVPIILAGFDGFWGLNFRPSHPLNELHFRWLVAAAVRKSSFSRSFAAEDRLPIQIITGTNELVPLALACIEHPISELQLVASGSYGHQRLSILIDVEGCLQQLFTIIGSRRAGLAPTPDHLLLFFERIPRRMIDTFFATPAAFGQRVKLTGAAVRRYIANGRIPHTRVIGRLYVFVPGAEDMLWSALRGEPNP